MTTKLLMSACLVGQCCRWDCRPITGVVTPRLHKMLDNGEVAVICPEFAGGLDIPREPAEIAPGCNAKSVLEGNGKVIDRQGTDVTEAYRTGANKALDLVKKLNIRVAVLNDRSPSCGVHCVHTGKFDGETTLGRGVTAELLASNGVQLFSAEELDAALAEIDKIA